MYGRSRGYGGYRSGYGSSPYEYGSSSSYGRAGSSSNKYNKQTYPKSLQQQQQQGAPTYKQTSYKPQYAKQTYSQTPSSQQYAQADRGKSKNYKPTTPSNQYKKKTVNKTVNVNQQPRRSRWGLGGFRSMWHIPMIFMFWRGFSRNRHQPQPQPQPQPQQNEPINITNMNYPSSPENTTAPVEHSQPGTNNTEESLPRSSQIIKPEQDETQSVSSYHSAEEEKKVDSYDNNKVPQVPTQD